VKRKTTSRGRRKAPFEKSVIELAKRARKERLALYTALSALLSEHLGELVVVRPAPRKATKGKPLTKAQAREYYRLFTEPRVAATFSLED
jgi:hypothetical protein